MDGALAAARHGEARKHGHGSDAISEKTLNKIHLYTLQNLRDKETSAGRSYRRRLSRLVEAAQSHPHEKKGVTTFKFRVPLIRLGVRGGGDV
jgi:hypothetical protein